MSALAELKKQRTQFMHRVYELTDGNELKRANMWQIGKELGFGEGHSELTDKIVWYLSREGLITAGMNGETGITHLGIKEVEQALEHPDEPTEHFTPFATVNFIHVSGNVVNSQFQQSGAGSTQTTTINSSQLAELNEIIRGLRDVLSNENLPPDQKDELNTEIETLSLQARSSKPKAHRIKESLISAKNILEGLAVGLTALVKGANLVETVRAKIDALLGSLS